MARIHKLIFVRQGNHRGKPHGKGSIIHTSDDNAAALLLGGCCEKLDDNDEREPVKLPLAPPAKKPPPAGTPAPVKAPEPKPDPEPEKAPAAGGKKPRPKKR